LNELDVLGIERNPSATDEEIAQALDAAARVKLRKGSKVLLVQSGAQFPDEPMVAELNRSLAVNPFSGLPNQFEREAYHKALRLAAARGGCETVICYWGVLESARQKLESKTVSWPLVAVVRTSISTCAFGSRSRSSMCGRATGRCFPRNHSNTRR
jgi:hypothetical protein